MHHPPHQRLRFVLVAALSITVCVCVFAAFGETLEAEDPYDAAFHGLSHAYSPPSFVTTDSAAVAGHRMLFVTHHGRKKHPATNNVQIFAYESKQGGHKWSFKGAMLEKSTLVEQQLANLRGLLVHENHLFIASAYTGKSKIVVADKCSLKPREAFEFASQNLDHPYELSLYDHQLYVTNQNLNSVVRFTVAKSAGTWLHGGGGPVDDPKPKHIHKRHGEKVVDVYQPRGIAFAADGMMWVASIRDGVLVFDPDTGKRVDRLRVRHPISVVYDHRTNLMYVGSADKGKNGKGYVYVLHGGTREVLGRMRPTGDNKFVHPAGIAVGNNKLYVIEQKAQRVYSFHLANSTYDRVVLEDLPKRPEQLVLVYC